MGDYDCSEADSVGSTCLHDYVFGFLSAPFLEILGRVILCTPVFQLFVAIKVQTICDSVSVLIE